MNQRGGSKTIILAKLVLVFFIALLSFSVGTFVGKKFSDNQHKIASLESYQYRDTASIRPDVMDVKPDVALTNEEIARLEEEFSADTSSTTRLPAQKHDEIDRSNHGKNELPPKAPEHMTSDKPAKQDIKAEKQLINKNDDVHNTNIAALAKSGKIIAEIAKRENVPSQAAQKVASGQIPAPEKDIIENRLPASLPALTASSLINKFTVQVASYANEEEAVKQTTHYKEQGFAAFYITANIQGKTWYRVSIGAYATKKEALDARLRIMQQAKLASAIVQKIEP